MPTSKDESTGWGARRFVGDATFRGGAHMDRPVVELHKPEREGVTVIGRVGVDHDVLHLRGAVDAAWQDVAAADPTLPPLRGGLKPDQRAKDPRYQLMVQVEAIGRGKLRADRLDWPITDATRDAWEALFAASVANEEAEFRRIQAAARERALEEEA
jgi:hypothetical protein